MKLLNLKKVKATAWGRAVPIGPDISDDWVDESGESLYWIARKEFTLPEDVSSADVLVVADRDYHMYVNDIRVAKRRNFFDATKYMWARRHDNISKRLKKGVNSLSFLIRSDPWRNKNHVALRPMLLCHVTMRHGDVVTTIDTDKSWEVSIISNWRSRIAMNNTGTIAFETIRLPEVRNQILVGVPNAIEFTNAKEIDPSVKIPEILRPSFAGARSRVHTKKRVVCENVCALPDRLLSFELSEAPKTRRGEPLFVFTAQFESAEERTLHFSASSIFHYRFELNDVAVKEKNSVPSIHQNPAKDYLSPAGSGLVKKGLNEIRIEILERQFTCGRFRFASDSPQLMDPSAWRGQNGTEPVARLETMELSESVGAKFIHEDLQTTIVEEDGAYTFKHQTLKDKLASLLLDMGDLLTGRLGFRIRSQSTGNILLGYGLFDANDKAVDCHAQMRRSVDVLEVPRGESVYDAFDVRAFRYLDLILENFEGDVKIDDIIVEEPLFFDEEASSFTASDEKINMLWRASRRTAQLCKTEIYTDNPDREHTQWIDNVYHNALSGYYLFGDTEQVAQVLEEFTFQQQSDGQLPGYAPGVWFPRKPLQCHMALFVFSCYEYFMHSGDYKFAHAIFDVIMAMIGHWETYRNSTGLLTGLETVFVDWGVHVYSYANVDGEPVGTLTSMNCYYLGVLSHAAEIARWTGKRGKQIELEQTRDDLAAAIRKNLFEPEVGLFRDGLGGDLVENSYSEPANALAVLFGAARKGDEHGILERAFCPRRGLDVIPANAHFTTQAGAALFNAEHDEFALQWIRKNFLPMLERGPGTIWERWDGFCSPCQGTGAGLAYLFARYFTGLHPLRPGYEVIGVDLHPSGLSSVNAELSTPKGTFHVDWSDGDTGIDYRLRVPKKLAGNEIVDVSSKKLSMTVTTA